jgi:hypothetical protein
VNRGYDGYNTRWALFLLHQLFPLVSFSLFLFSLVLVIVGSLASDCILCIIVLITALELQMGPFFFFFFLHMLEYMDSFIHL